MILHVQANGAQGGPYDCEPLHREIPILIIDESSEYEYIDKLKPQV